MKIGPPRPLPGGETPGMLRQRLKSLLADQFPSETPFTIQRLAELLLEPHKQYSRLDKLVHPSQAILSESVVFRADTDKGHPARTVSMSAQV